MKSLAIIGVLTGIFGLIYCVKGEMQIAATYVQTVAIILCALKILEKMK